MSLNTAWVGLGAGQMVPSWENRFRATFWGTDISRRLLFCYLYNKSRDWMGCKNKQTEWQRPKYSHKGCIRGLGTDKHNFANAQILAIYFIPPREKWMKDAKVIADKQNSCKVIVTLKVQGSSGSIQNGITWTSVLLFDHRLSCRRPQGCLVCLQPADQSRINTAL